MWDRVRHCSAACGRRLGPLDRRLEAAIESMLAARPGGATICPSEAARAVAPDDWRPLMERARAAARRLAAMGRLDVTQGGRAVDATQARGPIRLRARRLMAAPSPRPLP